MLDVKDQLETQLNARKEKNAFRVLTPPNELADFCSNDYLGLAQDQEILAQMVERASTVGATGSRLISGTSTLVEQLESELAAFHGTAAGLIFNSGYVANLGLLSCIASRQDTIIYDQLIHASLRDGIRLSNARAFSFYHNDLDHLLKKLERAKGNKYIVVESVYSMDGDQAMLPQIVALAQQFQAAVIVDEAHATGVLGPQGQGLVAACGLEKEVFARVHTFGKAIGSHGAIIVGDETLRHYLINFSRPFIYTTAMPDVILQGIQLAYQKMAAGDLVAQLHQNIMLFKSSVSQTVSQRLIPSNTAIQSLVVPQNDQVKWLACAIQRAGFDVRPILHPTVPEGQERLRICLHAFNQQEDIIALTGLLNQLII